MATIITAHGDRREDEPKTFVPPGTTVTFFGREDEYLPVTLGLAAIASGGAGSPVDSYQGGDECWNYHLYGLEDAIIAQIMTLDPGGHDLKFGGSDIPNDTAFCTTPDECKLENGQHSCDGVLGQYQGQELIIIACRGIEGADNATSEMYGGDPDDPLADIGGDLGQWVDEFAQKVRSDPSGAEAEFDALPEGTKAMLMPYHYIAAWNQARYVAYYSEQGDLEGLVNQINQNSVDPAMFKEAVDSVQEYVDSLLWLVTTYVDRALDEAMSNAVSDEQALYDHISAVKQWVGQQLYDDIDDQLDNYGPFQDLRQKVEQYAQERVDAE